MTIIEAAKILVQYPHQTRDRQTTGYGTVFECACCRHALNVHNGKHAPDCKLVEAVKVIEAAQ